MPLPDFDREGDLPPGIHCVPLVEVIARFGLGSVRRRNISTRLERIVRLARSTGHLFRVAVFGSFVTENPEPNDVDLFMLMEDGFDVDALVGEARGGPPRERSSSVRGATDHTRRRRSTPGNRLHLQAIRAPVLRRLNVGPRESRQPRLIFGTHRER